MITNKQKQLESGLKQRGERLTKPRRFILDYLSSVDCHPPAEKIYKILKRKLPQVSLGTIYRNLNYLARHGLIQQIMSSDNYYCFDANTDYHLHFICGECGKIYDLKNLKYRNIISFVEKQGKKIGKVRWIECKIYGTCQKCKIK